MLILIHGPQRGYSSIFGAEHGDSSFGLRVATSRVRISRFVCDISPVSAWWPIFPTLTPYASKGPSALRTVFFRLLQVRRQVESLFWRVFLDRSADGD